MSKTTYEYSKRGKMEWIVALLCIITVDVSVDIVTEIALLPHLAVIIILLFCSGESDHGLYSRCQQVAKELLGSMIAYPKKIKDC